MNDEMRMKEFRGYISKRGNAALPFFMPKLHHFGTFLDTKKAGLSKNGLRTTASILVWELWLL